MAKRGGKYRVEVTEGAVRVHCDGRTLTAPIEAPDEESEDADFVLHLEDLDHWDAPDEDTPIDIEELQKILDAVEGEFEKRGLAVDFE